MPFQDRRLYGYALATLDSLNGGWSLRLRNSRYGLNVHFRDGYFPGKDIDLELWLRCADSVKAGRELSGALYSGAANSHFFRDANRRSSFIQVFIVTT